MATATSRSIIRQRIESEWSTTPIAWENEHFQTPEPPAPYILVQHDSGEIEQRSIGGAAPTGPRWTEQGATLVHVMTPVGMGAQHAFQLAQSLTYVFRGLTLAGDLEVMEIGVGDAGPGDDDGMWWRLVVRIWWERG